MKTVNPNVADFAKEFAPYVTGNWQENHLDIYLREENGSIYLACYGLGKVNWSRFVEPDDPFFEKTKELIAAFPVPDCELHIQFYCGDVRTVEYIDCEGNIL